ncbi:MAG: peptide chain release factor aRF-1 [Candidatus Diapherotrites archaeon]
MQLKEPIVDEAEFSIFKKKIKYLAQFKGRGTELISVYIPENADRSSVMGQLTTEISQSSNIKSPQTRKSVQGALRKIINFLKSINYKLPTNGLVVFSGNVSEKEGQTNIRLFTVHPPKELKTKLYWCDSAFHLAPLKEMLKPTEVFGLVVIDKNEATIATLSGKTYSILGKFTSGVAGKARAGGQSAKRFEHLREEAAQDFYKRISEKINTVFVPVGDKLKGMIVGGPGMTKNYFLEKELVDHRLREKIIAIVDTAYTDESGIRELVQKSEDVLKDTELMRERKMVNDFLEAVSKDLAVAYGQKDVEEALALAKVKTLMLSEGVEWRVAKVVCGACGATDEFVVKNPLENIDDEKCRKCRGAIEVLEEIDYLDFLLEKAQATSAEVKVISTETPEGEQFLKSFGGIGAILRYK